MRAHRQPRKLCLQQRSVASLLLLATILWETLVSAFNFPSATFAPRHYQHYPSKGARSRTTYFGHPPGGERDPPLSEIITDIPDHFLLAPTEEHHLDLQENQRLVCVGDVHGDYKALKDFLEIAGVLSFEKSKSSSTNNSTDNSTKYSALPVEDNPVWAGNNTILVQCGDILDRGSQELACYQLLAQLSHQAKAQGGRVVCLYGNHEALNAMGLFQYATSDAEYEGVIGKLVDHQLDRHYSDISSGEEEEEDDDDQAQDDDGNESSVKGTSNETIVNATTVAGWRTQYVENQPARWAAYEPNGLLSRSLMANLKVAITVGRTLCVHGGLTKEHLEEYGGITGLNQKARAYILGEDFKNSITYNNRGKYLGRQQRWIEAEARQTIYINSMPKFLAGGIGAPTPLWMRDFSSPANCPPKNPKAQSMIDQALEGVDCDRMVMGHTVQEEINAALNGKAWRIDVGASRGVRGGKPEVLEIINVNGTEAVSVLTKYSKVPGENRHVWALAELL